MLSFRNVGFCLVQQSTSHKNKTLGDIIFRFPSLLLLLLLFRFGFHAGEDRISNVCRYLTANGFVCLCGV